MSMLWTSEEAAAATGGEATGAWEVTGLSIDSRSVAAGDMFVALTAARDGHDFVADALAKGATCALVNRIPDGDDPKRLLIVDDVQIGLEALARAARARTEARVLAITGSVGKTSAKEMAAHALSAQGKTHAAVKSFNNHWGVPLTLARMPREAAFAVIEIGMNHPGEIAPLTRLTRPDVAIVTTVGPVHMEAFADGEPGIAREKAAIYKGLDAQGVAIWNADLSVSPLLQEGAEAHTAVSFGTDPKADWHLESVTSAQGALSCVANTPQGRLMFKLGAPGRHFALGALAVLAAISAMGGDLSRAALSLGDWTPPAGRGARRFVALDPVRPEVGIDLIDDSYNANPTSVGAGLALLAEATPPKGKRRIAILGDMKELGPSERALHAALADLPATQEIDQIHTAGPLMSALHAALPPARRGRHVEDAGALLDDLHHLIGPGDTVLIKGSLSMGMARVVDAITQLGHSQGKFTRD